jgi:hypothetical protein
MRVLLTTLIALAIGCTTTEKEKGLFDNFEDKETVVIYLSQYNLDSIPGEIGKLKKVRYLYITKDSTNGWAIFPHQKSLNN